MTVILSNIKEEWKATKGKNINIGICDSGIDKNRTELVNSIKEYRKYGDVDHQIHGNHICGIIFGTNNKSGVIKSLSPLSNAFTADVNLKVSNSLADLENALIWLSEFKLDILNLSLAYDENNGKIKDILNNIYQNGTWIFASFSEKRGFPWSYDFVNGVGYKYEHRIDIVAANQCKSLGTNYKNSFIEGSSVSCALVSSVAGAYRAFDKNKTIDDFKKEINGKNMYMPEINRDNKKKYTVLGESEK